MNSNEMLEFLDKNVPIFLSQLPEDMFGTKHYHWGTKRKLSKMFWKWCLTRHGVFLNTRVEVFYELVEKSEVWKTHGVRCGGNFKHYPTYIGIYLA